MIRISLSIFDLDREITNSSPGEIEEITARHAFTLSSSIVTLDAAASPFFSFFRQKLDI